MKTRIKTETYRNILLDIGCLMYMSSSLFTNILSNAQWWGDFLLSTNISFCNSLYLLAWQSKNWSLSNQENSFQLDWINLTSPHVGGMGMGSILTLEKGVSLIVHFLLLFHLASSSCFYFYLQWCNVLCTYSYILAFGFPSRNRFTKWSGFSF